ncbi:DNA replication/repair protein RecF [Eubacterium oxidoreducens]|uniref:DNA replication and repair protein RecF n=1 Tax=Eubacterium oxidoreducens TaxID=1732 RepID=A0A1G6CQ03_EUBOX|nr:DNA replication/repair protein RecF [Eubacterium oxidoreducens]SDB34805.1 DNA replication and repair protein RecF [Eubacterium oxidoreducens]
MIVKSIKLNQFRNYNYLDINLSPGTNIFYGDNAQGKTNILEALYVSATSKSHKGSHDRDMIQFGKEESHIQVNVEKNEKDYMIDIHLKNNKAKGIAINKIAIKKASEIFGILNIIFFSPEDLNIIKKGPSERRRFLDLELCQLDKIYLYNLTNYNKVVQQRNKLLKDIAFNSSLEETLPIWDMQLIKYGSYLIERRKKFVQEIAPIVRKTHYKISGEREVLELSYEPEVEIENFEKQLKENKWKDLKNRITTTGPHRDDLSFLIEGVDIRKFGSQGQQRTSALSLKLSEIEIVKKTIDDEPVLLLDDVLSELDSNRQNYLLQQIKETQTLITCTGLDEFVKNSFEVDKVFQVISGNVSEKLQEQM